MKSLLIALILLVPATALAQMELFQENPFFQGTSESFLQKLYTAAISVAAILVVLRLIYAGVQYMLSEVVTSKQKAREAIQSSLLGLLVILGSVTILTTINPNLVNLDVIGKGTPANTTTGVNDLVDFNVGERISQGTPLSHCGGTYLFGWSGMDQNCVNQYMRALRKSCETDGGELGVTASGFYTCEVSSPSPR